MLTGGGPHSGAAPHNRRTVELRRHDLTNPNLIPTKELWRSVSLCKGEEHKLGP